MCVWCVVVVCDVVCDVWCVMCGVWCAMSPSEAATFTTSPRSMVERLPGKRC